MNTATITYEERRELEKKQAKEAYDALLIKTNEIAHALGGKVHAKPATTMYSFPDLLIALPDKYNLRVSIMAADKGKLHVSGSYEHGLLDYKPYNAQTPSINVSASKSAEIIAKDIQRRFLPAFKELVDNMRARKAATETAENARLSTARKLVDSSRGEFILRSDNQGKELAELVPNNRRYYGDIKIYSDSASVELRSLSLDQARAIVNALAEEGRE